MNIRPAAAVLLTCFVISIPAAAQLENRVPLEYLETQDDPPAPVAARDNLLARSPGRIVAVGGYVSVQVNVDAFGQNIVGDAANEPSIAVDPTDRSNKTIGWRQFDSVISNFRQAGRAYTLDSGQTWIFPGVLSPGLFRSDPVLDADSSGTFYYNSLQGDFSADVFESTTDGITWGPPLPSFGGDKNWMIVDKSGSIGDGNVYVTWQIVGGCCGNDTITRSVDGASDFEEPVFIPEIPGLGSLAVGADGELYVTGVQATGNEFVFSRSDNAKDPNEIPTFVTTEVDLGGEFGGGGFFGDSPNPGGLLGQVWTGAAPSGEVYVLASVDPPGDDPQDIYVIRSDDRGLTWTEPTRVNDDAEDEDSWQWFGTLGVAPNGRLDAIWADTRESLDVRLSRVYYSYSWDGGETWSENIAVSPQFDSQIGWPNQNKIGDYYELESDETGTDLAYAATFNGEQDVYYLRLFPDCNVNGVSDVTDIDNGDSADRNADLQPDECQLVLADPSPGQAGESNTFRAEAGTPGASVTFLFSTAVGSTPVPNCAGETVGLEAPTLIGSAVVDGEGVAEITVNVPDGAGGQTAGFQAVEADTCTVSNSRLFTFLR